MNSNTRIKGIALSAKMRVGKDSTCAAITSTDTRFYRLAFADRLKELASYVTGVNFFNEENKVKHRGFLIAFGQFVRNNWSKEHWVNEALRTAKTNMGVRL